MITTLIEHTHTWYRVADPAWSNPVDTSYSYLHGGRWNSPGSHHTLYLCGDLPTARAQIPRMLATTMFTPQDLRDDAFVAIPIQLLGTQTVADAITTAGLHALRLPPTYPIDSRGQPVSRAVCQPVGDAVAAAGLDGVHARSATLGALPSDQELAWFPGPSQQAIISGDPLPYQQWRGLST